MKKGTTGTITWGDGTTSKVIIDSVQTYPASGMPSYYMMDYQPDETHRPLIHPQLGTLFPLPAGILRMCFTADDTSGESDEEKDTYLVKLNNYIHNNFNPEDQAEGMSLIRRVERLKGREYVIKTYFEKEQVG